MENKSNDGNNKQKQNNKDNFEKKRTVQKPTKSDNKSNKNSKNINKPVPSSQKTYSDINNIKKNTFNQEVKRRKNNNDNTDKEKNNKPKQSQIVDKNKPEIKKTQNNNSNRGKKSKPKQTQILDKNKPEIKKTEQNKNKSNTEKKSRNKKPENVQKPTPSKPKKLSIQPLIQEDIDRQATAMLSKPQKKLSSRKKAYLKPLAPPKEPISPYKRKLKRILFYTFTIFILLAICSLLSLTVFFKIDNIEVIGETRYNTNEIISASMINKGDNLILSNTNAGEREIEKNFPYIEKVDIQKNLFNTIKIFVTEAKPASIIESKGQYVVLSNSGKIIEVNKEKKYNVPTVLGADLERVKLSSTIKYKNENIKKYLDEIMYAIKENNIKNIETVDISNLSKITLINNNGFKIVIGTPENVDYKLHTAKTIIARKDNENIKGTLDVSLASPDGGKSYLSDEKTEISSEIKQNSSNPKNNNESSKQNSNTSTTENSDTSTAESSDENSSTGTEESSEEISE